MTHAPTDNRNAFAATLQSWPDPAQVRFAEIRALILDAAQDADVGPVEETLKWGQPAWRPKRARTGSTLRLNWHEKSPQTLVLFVDCKTTLSATMREIYPHDFQYESNRALHLQLAARLPDQAIHHLAQLTFTYHRKG